MSAAYLGAGAVPIDRKVIATLRARAALAGLTLLVVDDDRGKPLFVISRGALTKQLGTLDEVEAFLERARGLRLVRTRREVSDG